MGNKIITEKDFWICSCGAVPAQLQSQQESVKKKSGEKYITVMDKSTSSWIDFGCTRLMLIYAIIAAAVVVIAAMTVATGGAALIALGALAGLAGAAWGAIVGSLLCGQLAAKARKWEGSKNDYIIQQVHAISGAHKMTCPVGGTITFAPEIKNWSQAIALGASNYIGHLMEGMMAGAAIGMGGAALSGGAGAFASGGIRGLGQAALQFAKSAPLNVIKNIGATFGISAAGSSTTTVVTTAATAVGLRSLTATQAGLQHYGSTGESGWGAAGRGVFGMEEGMYHSGANILSGNAGWQDVAGLALLLSPVHKAPEELNAKKSEPVQNGEPARDGEQGQDAEQNVADDENIKQANNNPEETTKNDGEGDAYEYGANDPIKQGFDDLAAKREELGLPKAGSLADAATLSKLKIGDTEFSGINSKLQNPKTKITLKANAQTKTHAEAEAVQKAIDAGKKGTAKEAEMWTDRDACDACGKYNGIGSLARELGLERIIVHSPSGTKTYYPPK
ncbi:deaminase [Pedobacter sp. R20-19]|uniref:deaminase n=1 Tax=Pedobacter sp. R20-19 TaxID=1270196 RepID=UPI00068DCB2B|nr:deaminase [Pedobacter sp. R20-19]